MKPTADALVVSLLAEPDAPTEIARRIAEAWPDGQRFDVAVVSEPFSTGTEDLPALLSRITDRARAESWDVVVALTDLPLHSDGRKVKVGLDRERGAALVSLPALGGFRLPARAQRAVQEAMAGLTGTEDAIDLRYVAAGPRGHLQVLAGMVRANRPWRLVPGLSRSFAAALATGAIATVNSTIWSLADSLSIARLVIATIGSVALMTGWLIVDAHLWHRSSGASPEARQKRRLYNTSTVITLGIGVLVCYGGLFVINLVWALFIVNGRVWASMTQTPMHTGAYATLAWLVASVATVGGALGSGLEGDEAVRAAAYSRREQERRRSLEDDAGR